MFHGGRTKVSFVGKFLRLDSSLAWPKPIAQAISLEKFHGANQSTKTVKIFHLKQFAMYGICLYVAISHYFTNFIGEVNEDKLANISITSAQSQLYVENQGSWLIEDAHSITVSKLWCIVYTWIKGPEYGQYGVNPYLHVFKLE